VSDQPPTETPTPTPTVYGWLADLEVMTDTTPPLITGIWLLDRDSVIYEIDYPIDAPSTQQRKKRLTVAITDDSSGVDGWSIMFILNGVVQPRSDVIWGHSDGLDRLRPNTADASLWPSHLRPKSVEASLVPSQPLLSPSAFPQTKRIEWSVIASDLNGNQTRSDADPDLPGFQPFVFTIDRVSPNIITAFAGSWWSSLLPGVEKPNGAESRIDSILVMFDEPLDIDTVEETDFLVDGITPISALVPVDSPDMVLLTMARELDLNSSPVISLVSWISDRTWNTAVGDEVIAQDGIK
jgi:hypothetical protein